MTKITRTVLVTTEVTVEFDEDIMPDDDWRENFYSSIDDHDRLAEHLAYNYVRNRIDRLTRLDGFADRQDHEAKFHLESCEAECSGRLQNDGR